MDRPQGGVMRHRLITYLDALFIGMILGLLFVTLVHASSAPATGQVLTNHWITIGNHIRQLRH
jgi:hypothetical protein